MTTTVPAHAPPVPPPSAPRTPHAAHPLVDGHAKADWLLRVLAVLLDSALVASITWLATSDAPTFAALPLLSRAEELSLDSDAVGWTLASLLGLGILQAYTGMTPGKRVTGICVVDAGSGRPIGLAGTVLRWLAHFLDAFLMLGYLRAAWHPQGRTFADSLLGTVVVLSSRPRPHRWVAWLRRLRDGRAPWLRWRRNVTSVVALVVCAAAAAMSLVQGSGGSMHSAETESSCTSSADVAVTAMVGSAASASWESRLGIRRTTEQSWQVVVGWSTGLGADDAGRAAPDITEATLTVRSPDGRFYSSQDATSSDDTSPFGDDEPWWTIPDLIASTSLEAHEDVSGWTATAVLLDDGGTVVAECSAPVPAVEAAR